LGTCDFGILQFDHPADTVLGVHYEIANIEAKGFRRHIWTFLKSFRRFLAVYAPCSPPTGDPPVTAYALAKLILHETTVADRGGLCRII
jgi:hypothetical protein